MSGDDKVVPPEERGDSLCGPLPSQGVDSGGGGVSQEPGRSMAEVKRKNRNAYMALYMRKRRERKKKANVDGSEETEVSPSEGVQGTDESVG